MPCPRRTSSRRISGGSSPCRRQALPKRYAATPVVRDSGSVSGTQGRDFTLVALPAQALAHIDGWRSDFSSRTPAELGALLRPAVDAAAARDPARGHAPDVPVHDDRRPRRRSTAIVENRRGDFTRLDFGEHGPGAHTPTVAVPPEARGGRIVALRVTFPLVASYVAGHHAGEAAHAVNDASTGTLRLGPQFKGWFGTNGVRVDGAVLRFVVNNAADAIIRPHEPLEGELVPVVVSPAIARAAGPSGIVPLHAENNVITGKIVATTRYFPSVDGDVVVADLADLARGGQHARARRRDAVRALARVAAAARPAAAGRRRNARASTS